MQNLFDTIGNLFTSSGAIHLPSLILSLLLAFALGLFIFYIYRRTFNGVLYNRNYNVSLVLLTMVATLILKSITSNFALSLGMVGALSIVRYRTAVKDPLDTAFMFWAIGIGITIGAGFYTMAIIGSAIIGIFLYVMFNMQMKRLVSYLLVVRHDFDSANEVNHMISGLPKGSRIKSKSVTRNGVEITVELRLSDDDSSLVDEFMEIEGVYDATLISYQGDFGV